MKPSSSEIAQTVRYYDEHADEFCARTQHSEMSALYEPFVSRLPSRGRILDAGCGSGRDSAAFLRMGYDVLSIDASAAMVAATTALTGRSALQMRFDEIAFEEEFDGIWACASLLHVPRAGLPDVLGRLRKALRPGGILYVSFKYGQVEEVREERHFTDLDEPLLTDVVDGLPSLRIERLWVSADVRGGWHQDWLNALLGKVGSLAPG